MVFWLGFSRGLIRFGLVFLGGWLSVWLVGLFVCWTLLILRIDTREIEAFIYQFDSVQVSTFDEMELILMLGLPHSPHQYQPMVCCETAI